MASVIDKQLSDGSKASLVRFRTADGAQRSKQFERCRDALAFANVTEVDREHGTLVDTRLGRITVREWWDQWWPTVTNLRPSTKARDEQLFRGLRLGEMLSLRCKRVDHLRRRVDIAETLVGIGGHITVGPPTTQATVRTLRLPVRP